MDIFAECGDAQRLTAYIDQGCNYKVNNDEGFTLLHEAAGRGYYQSVQILLEAAWNEYDCAEDIIRYVCPLVSGETPLSLAAAHGYHQIVKLLVVLYVGCSAEETGYAFYKAGQFVPVQYALQVHECVTILGKQLPDHVNTVNHLTGLFPIHDAASRSSWLDWPTLMIGLGANVNERQKDGFTPMHYAASVGNEWNVQSLYRADANPLATNDMGEIPLIVAARERRWEIVKYLAEINLNSYIESISSAAFEGKKQLLDNLLEEGFPGWDTVLPKCAQRGVLENTAICTRIKILLENRTSFLSLARSRRLEGILPRRLVDVHESALTIFLDHGLMELRYSCSPSTPSLTAIIQLFENTKSYLSCNNTISSKAILCLSYLPFVELTNSSLTNASLVPVVSSLKRLCRWRIRCCIICHNDCRPLCSDDIASLPLSHALKKFLF